LNGEPVTDVRLNKELPTDESSQLYTKKYLKTIIIIIFMAIIALVLINVFISVYWEQ